VLESALAEHPKSFWKSVNIKPVLASCALAIGLPLAAWVYHAQSQRSNALDFQQAHLLASAEEDIKPLMEPKVATLIRNAEEAVKQKDWAKAQTCYAEAASEAPHNAIVWEAAAIAYVKEKKYDKALDVLKSASSPSKRLVYLANCVEAAKQGVRVTENTWTIPKIFGNDPK
jgi:tetratricopeptide (TPR) repeat protein